MSKVLLNIITDRLSQIIAKGSIIDRYYNPGNVFDEVHILMTNEDRPDPKMLQRTVGDAELFLHNLPSGIPLVARTMWRPFLLKGWAEDGIRIAETIKPDLLRCYGNFLNGMLAVEIKKHLGIPLFVSLHTQPDETRANREIDMKTRIYYTLSKALEKYTLRNADLVGAVYGSIEDYTKRLEIKNVRRTYNVINPEHISKKSSYSSPELLRMLYVGRIIPGKNPENIIKALPGRKAHLTIMGDGSMKNEMMALAENLHLEELIDFKGPIPNDDVCRSMKEYDILVSHSQYGEIPKTVLEATLTGLPVLANYKRGNPVPEYQEGWAKMVDDSPEGFGDGIDFYMDEANRRKNGQAGAAYADSHWNPVITEKLFADIQRKLAETGRYE
ncbi:glycosyltransferase [Maridesulfovibrio bastinii]|uniref:glycosyltransferase n=1 Tax=Maridesulfovibrio bastinii TaxID=47157 RepID=UPI0003F4FE22|nr:glycosyltransferase [Maridesulfovibrio bastinii]